MERFPNKISLAVFLSAFMPDTASPPAHVINEIIPRGYQIWMLENYAVEAVKEIKGADHMAMLSKPKELFELLMEIAL
ncbi:putative methylesterase 19 [Acorus calamus]|uniref:Methylesterase 19 n=1 Tax=Acorus calamus TaxID=4465 RepID=A0AAV9DHH2_ACOCL|nr:putative methylesterase 19 [Acorus calamus]